MAAHSSSYTHMNIVIFKSSGSVYLHRKGDENVVMESKSLAEIDKMIPIGTPIKVNIFDFDKFFAYLPTLLAKTKMSNISINLQIATRSNVYRLTKAMYGYMALTDLKIDIINPLHIHVDELIDTMAVDLIKTLPQLETLDLSFGDHSGLESLVIALENIANLKALKYSANSRLRLEVDPVIVYAVNNVPIVGLKRIRKPDINFLAGNLPTNTTVKMLTLDINSDASIAGLGEGLSSNTTLLELVLVSPDMKLVGVNDFFRNLIPNTTLINLAIKFQDDTSIPGIVDFLNENTTLESLGLVMGSMRDIPYALISSVASSKLLGFGLAVGTSQIPILPTELFLNAIRNNTTLERLKLNIVRTDHMMLDPAVITDFLITNTKIEELTLLGDYPSLVFTADQLDAIRRTNKTLLRIMLREDTNKAQELNQITKRNSFNKQQRGSLLLNLMFPQVTK